jgi:hypothetical protein
MQTLIPLNLPKATLTLTRKDNVIFVNCLIRKKKIILTPEEWVRQHFIAFLHHQQGFPISRIAVEKSIQYGSLTKRWDILVYDANFHPLVLIECKAPSVSITKDTLYQALTYQKEMQGRFIILTNGLDHSTFEVDLINQNFIEKKEIPKNS